VDTGHTTGNKDIKCYPASGKHFMKSMDMSLLELVKDGKITAESALAYATDPEYMKKMLSG